MSVLGKALLSDSIFLATAVRDAERAHTGVGLWDVLGDAGSGSGSGSTVDMSLVLEHVCVNDEASHFHFSRFHVVRCALSNDIAAVACGYVYPICSMSNSKPGINLALKSIYNWSEEEVSQAWHRLQFLDDCFPDFDYDDSWMLEAVYTAPSHRGKGFAAEVLRSLLAEGKASSGCKKALITCAIGNDRAKRLYERVGFTVVGQGSSEIAMEKLGSPGFYLLCLYF
eukprot:gene2600-2843_t